MDRLNVSQTRAEELRDECEANYPGYGDPVPASALKVFDDVLWLDGLFPMRIVWGHDHPDYFNAYCPEFFGEGSCNCEGTYVTDRAPADPNETPMPIFPQQQQQRQGSAPAYDKKKALQHLLKQLSPTSAKKVRELVKQKRPELLDGDRP